MSVEFSIKSPASFDQNDWLKRLRQKLGSDDSPVLLCLRW